MRRRGKSWELRVYLEREAVSGKRRWATRTVRAGKREAQRALTAMVAEADTGTLARTDATVGELLERWFEQAKDVLPDLTHSTLQRLDSCFGPPTPNPGRRSGVKP